MFRCNRYNFGRLISGSFVWIKDGPNGSQFITALYKDFVSASATIAFSVGSPHVLNHQTGLPLHDLMSLVPSAPTCTASNLGLNMTHYAANGRQFFLPACRAKICSRISSATAGSDLIASSTSANVHFSDFDCRRPAF